MIPFAAWNAAKAFWVADPKYPVGAETAVKYPPLIKICWSAVTSAPFEPTVRFLVKVYEVVAIAGVPEEFNWP